MLNNFFFFENPSVYEAMWKNIVDTGWPQVPIWRKPISCWTLRATNTHSEYVILLLSTATMVARPHLRVTLYVRKFRVFFESLSRRLKRH